MISIIHLAALLVVIWFFVGFVVALFRFVSVGMVADYRFVGGNVDGLYLSKKFLLFRVVWPGYLSFLISANRKFSRGIYRVIWRYGKPKEVKIVIRSEFYIYFRAFQKEWLQMGNGKLSLWKTVLNFVDSMVVGPLLVVVYLVLLAVFNGKLKSDY